MVQTVETTERGRTRGEDASVCVEVDRVDFALMAMVLPDHRARRHVPVQDGFVPSARSKLGVVGRAG